MSFCKISGKENVLWGENLCNLLDRKQDLTSFSAFFISVGAEGTTVRMRRFLATKIMSASHSTNNSDE